ncbi:MAG: DNA primase [Caloramator sp.]|nr:DNA primase [Caloramator sp.]
MRIPEQVIENILQKNDIVDVISEYVSLKRVGKNFMGVCPFHNDKGPSLSVSPDKQLFHCFGCGAAGNVVGFIMKIRNIDYIDAIKFLADRVNIPLETSSYGDNEVEKIYEINIQAARFYYSNLKQNSDKIKYLLNRGLDLKTVQRFGLGYSLDSYDALLNFLKKRGYDEKLLLKAGLVSQKDNKIYDRFRNRIMFPVFDHKGRVIGFGGRVLDDSKPKYLNSPETPVFKKGTNLYALNFVLKKGMPDELILVEGYMDCIKLHQHGIENTVATLGTALTKEQARLIKRYCNTVYLCYDSDAAGRTATLRGIEVLHSEGLNVKIINIPRGKDPDEFINTFGVDEFKRLVEKSLPAIEHLIFASKENKNFDDPRDRSNFIKEVIDILKILNSEVEIHSYAAKIYELTGISLQVILDQLNKAKNIKSNNWNNNYVNRNNNIGGNNFIEPGYKKAERKLLMLILKNDDIKEYIIQRINKEDFITPSYKKAAMLITERGLKEFNDIVKHFEEQNEIQDVALIFAEEDLTTLDLETIEGFIKTLKRTNLERQIENIKLKIKEKEKSDGYDELLYLTKKLEELKKQLSLL